MKIEKFTNAEFERRFFPGSTRIAPGIWIDRAGGMHFSVPELLAMVGLPNTLENREEIAAMVAKMLEENKRPGAEIVRTERKEDA